MRPYYEHDGSGMLCIAVDTYLADTPEAIEFCELLDSEHACVHLLYLWSWAMASECRDGVVKINPTIAARVCRWSGDREILFDALRRPLGPRARSWLIALDNGYYYLRGWSRYRRYFEEKDSHFDASEVFYYVD